MARKPTVPEFDAFLHEPARLRILVLLASVAEADFMFALQQTGLSRGNLSVQLSKLEAAGLISLDRRLHGTRARTCYRLSKTGNQALRAYKKAMLQLIEVFPD